VLALVPQQVQALVLEQQLELAPVLALQLVLAQELQPLVQQLQLVLEQQRLGR
jgi:hypothetical protein